MLRSSDEGAVVLLSSALALVAPARMAFYVATKAAIHSLARSLRAELDGEVKVFDVRSDKPVARGLDRGPRYRLTTEAGWDRVIRLRVRVQHRYPQRADIEIGITRRPEIPRTEGDEHAVR
jgi:hypothetical protein